MEPIIYLMISSLVELTNRTMTQYGLPIEQSGEGLHSDESTVKTILKAEPPATVSEVRRFLGLAQFWARLRISNGYAVGVDPWWQALRVTSWATESLWQNLGADHRSPHSGTLLKRSAYEARHICLTCWARCSVGAATTQRYLQAGLLRQPLSDISGAPVCAVRDRSLDCNVGFWTSSPLSVGYPFWHSYRPQAIGQCLWP